MAISPARGCTSLFSQVEKQQWCKLAVKQGQDRKKASATWTVQRAGAVLAPRQTKRGPALVKSANDEI